MSVQKERPRIRSKTHRRDVCQLAWEHLGATRSEEEPGEVAGERKVRAKCSGNTAQSHLKMCNR